MAPGDFECLLEQGFSFSFSGDLQWFSGGRFAEELPLDVTAQSRREDAVSVREDAVLVEQRFCGVIWQWVRRFSALRRLPFQLGVLQEDSALFLSVFLELLRCSWERQRFH